MVLAVSTAWRYSARPIGNFFGWISYTLQKRRLDYPSYTDEQLEDNAGTAWTPTDNEWYPFAYDQTHILVAVAGYKLPYGSTTSSLLLRDRKSTRPTALGSTTSTPTITPHSRR